MIRVSDFLKQHKRDYIIVVFFNKLTNNKEITFNICAKLG